MPKGLTPQQRLFAVEVASGKTQRDAAIAAGYSPKSADRIATRLVKNGPVAAEIARIQNKATACAFVDRTRTLEIIGNALESAAEAGDSAAIARLGELNLKAQGHLVERREVRTDIVVELEWDSQVIVSGGGDES